MASNSFGNLLKMTTWGESHGKAMGVVIDGLPAGLEINELEINQQLEKRQGGKTPWTTKRSEPDLAEIYSGVYEGKTTGAPLSIIILNEDKQSSAYTSMNRLYRPGHASFTYHKKYGHFDPVGGGRASARETVCRVAAGAVAKKLLKIYDIEVLAYISSIAHIQISEELDSFDVLKQKVYSSPIFCPDKKTSQSMIHELEKVIEKKDSLGGVVSLTTTKLPIGLGEPLYLKLEAMLAQAMLSIPASKGIEFGLGFKSSEAFGSEHNDLLDTSAPEEPKFLTNHSGGILGGISNGMNLLLKVAFKPTSTIGTLQKTFDFDHNPITYTPAKNSRHDPCVALRAPPIVEAMAALCLADAVLMHKAHQLC